MLLKSALDLRKSIEEDRYDMYKLAKNTDFSDPGILKISQQLDKKIILMQKLISEIRSSTLDLQILNSIISKHENF
ncbi:Spo0E family sporulation regulatory protein-aspartic acid phosphatase [Domibacillus sp. PGB-M46]|uniref:Spo0E family sporulation regulatory protein-aspartic acid phosphatase n=1 Tax=Domibacillus sp. PGB-M46 TaxID=2910255 RepID=UPI002101E48D|nr:Spo0E family sporulation regulatory protein-aspartic acid phosphatase [Domibacillus sp. PGB-M46]